jgi:DNA modification methylase
MEEATQEAEQMISKRKVENGKIQAVIPNTITYSGGGGAKIHPTQKPVEVLRYFIELLTQEGDTVLDTFAGSGSTGRACQDSDRNCILIERDKKMFEKMSKQFNELFTNR